MKELQPTSSSVYLSPPVSNLVPGYTVLVTKSIVSFDLLNMYIRAIINNIETGTNSNDINEEVLSISNEEEDYDIINNKKPLKMFFHENNISTINSNNEKFQNIENIND